MQLTCPHCRKVVEFAERQPSKCFACGRPLQAAIDDATLDYYPVPGTRKTIIDEIGGPSSATDDRIGDYRLLRRLGQGGMGTVWEAEQAGTGRRLALKLLSPRLSPTTENVDRFLREAKLAASVSHPRSTFVFGAGQQNGQPYIAMELMPGRTLKDVLDEEGPLPVERAVDYILDVIDGLEAAHALGVIHRDVKPSNCFLDGDGRVKVGDFGLSKSLVSEADLTQTGAFLGTPQFAAPEQVKGGAVDQRTDVYAVGATLFCLLAGRAPFEGDAAAVIAQIVSDPAPRLSSVRPDLRKSIDRVTHLRQRQPGADVRELALTRDAPEPLSRIVARTLEKAPTRRFDDLAGLRRALTPFASGGVSMADVGRRFAAYMLDEIIVGSVPLAVVMPVAIVKSVPALTGFDFDRTLDVWVQLFVTVAGVFYFALTEACWGRGLGKRLMGLQVIGPDGDRPGYFRSVTRAWLLPGATGLVGLPFCLMLYRSCGLLSAPAVGFDWQLSLLNICPFVFILLCTTSMRARNGYRGWHELASGTRVIRLRKAVAARPRQVPTVLPVATLGEPVRFGPFRAIGELGRSDELQLAEARDEQLGRAVWIYRGPSATAIPDARRRVIRHTRPYWLQGGELAQGRWDAFEAVIGAPLSQIALEPAGTAWQESRHWLLDLCEELAAALDDDTLPKELSVDQIWIAQGGRLKLLDAPLAPPGSTLEGMKYTGTADERALGLFRAAIALCTRRQILPQHVRDFVDELVPSALSGRETFAWAASRLRDAAKQPTAIGWDDRLGILAVSMGTELTFYTSVAFGLPCLLVMCLDWPIERLASLVGLPLLLPVLIGYLLRGGPAFWLTHIHVLQADGGRASRLRCAWRSFVAWAPMMILYGWLGILVGWMVGHKPQHLQSDTVGFWLFLGGFCGGELLGLLFLIGAVYAVARPQRGWQDILSGTWLAPH